MNTPVRIYRKRSRHRVLPRLKTELFCGLALAGVVLSLPWIIAEGPWIMTLGGLVVWGILGIAQWARTDSRRSIVLYDDHFTWYDPGGLPGKAKYEDIEEIRPDTRQFGYLVYTKGRTLWITPDIEGFRDLLFRISSRSSGPALVPRGKQEWTGPTEFRPKPRVLRSGLWLLALSIAAFILHPIGWPDYVDLLRLVGVAALLGSAYQLLNYFFMRIQIQDGELVWRGWHGFVLRRVLVGGILGATAQTVWNGTHGAIDTDDGEILLPPTLGGIDDLVSEAERLGADRFARASALAPRIDAAEAATVRASTG